MKTITKTLLIFLSVLYFNLTYAQADFKTGFIVKNGGEKVACLIMEEDWKYNPTSFTYKLEDTNGVLTGTLSEFEAFGIESSFKYIKKENFLKEEAIDKPVFLNVLEEGDISIYEYRDKETKIYFYKESSKDEIRELIYRDYSNKKNGDFLTQSKYKSQLYKAFNSDNSYLNEVKTLKYKKNEILALVSDYNNGNSTIYSKYYNASEEKTKFYLKAGIGNTPLVINNSSIGEFIDFGNDTGFRIGAEFEYFLPVKSKQWSITISPMVKHQSVEKTTTTPLNVIEDKFTYTAFEMQFGSRYYFNSTEANSRFYANAGLLAEIPIQSELKFGDEETDVGIVNALNFYVGIGYQYKRFGAELKYIPNLRIITTNSEYSVEFETLAFQLTYNLF